MSILDSRLLANVKSAEGYKLTAYRDSLGFWTIGFGHLLGNEKDWTGFTITEAQAELYLINDLQKAATLVSTLPEARGLDPVRMDALIELMYNMGPGGYATFVNTRAAIADRNWQKAHDGLLASRWASQVGPLRSTRIANEILTGV